MDRGLNVSYYIKLGVGKHLGHEVVIGTDDGKYYRGILSDGLVNEDWEEDGEKEELGLDIGENILCIELETIEFLTKASDIDYIKKVG